MKMYTYFVFYRYWIVGGYNSGYGNRIIKLTNLIDDCISLREVEQIITSSHILDLPGFNCVIANFKLLNSRRAEKIPDNIIMINGGRPNENPPQ